MEKSKLGFLALAATMWPGIGSYALETRRSPHYIEYSGIPTEEQKRKSAERKARKLAKKARKNNSKVR